MLNRAVAISTLALLAAGELNHQAIASPDVVSSTPEPAARSYVVPVEASPAPQPSTAVASPEVVVTPEFAQITQTPVSATASDLPIQSTPILAQSTRANTNVVVTTTPASTQPTRTPVNSINPPSGTTTTSTTINTQAQATQTPARAVVSNDLAVTAVDVQVRGVTQELQQVVLNTIGTRAGGSTSQSQLDSDVAAILNTGLFANARVSTSQSQDGLSVVYQVEPVILRSLQLSGNQVLTPAVANDFFKSQIGQPISPTAMRQGIQQLSKWYTDNGYTLAQVLDAQPSRNGVVTIAVAEGVIGDINVRFLDKEGKPAEGRTREDFIRSELKLQPGQIFRVDVARQDLQQLYQLGLFDNANVALNGDARNVDVTYELTERPARGVNVGGGYSGSTGVFGTISYKDQNLGGINQQLGLNVQASGRDLQFNGNFTDPYRASNQDKPGYSVDVFRRRSVSTVFDDNFANDIEAEDYDEPNQGQFGAGVRLSKPIDDWQASVGLNYTRTSIRDDDGNIISVDALGKPLSFSGTGIDDLITVSAGVTKDQRNNPVNPTQGSVLSLSTEQSIPVGNGNIFMNRLQANYSQYTPVDLLGGDKPEVLAFNVQGGTTIGDLPPYQAFNLGGINSVRGYGTGDVGSGRTYVLASAEYRVPLFNPVGAVLFADFASDLGTGDTVPGEPGIVRGKPGTGFGYGAGLRVDSPIGIIRADYGFTDQGDSQLQFGIGQRF
ncbi:MAG: BamA/TamA family outer membrane protein [Symplocastrum torsivum CPER-KK1]|jgi:outer membrane protein insertion porin family|uniref:BamA/TamA family outer membrane protein n=1 Tax=Symplocastrum torsivum CPER-KK1 TaxID=450513 RepID=A0A951PSV0_9CYAN|nr:BamA/TamA family outer membrane protein [Symplocastrum torsivum CPER-KK1]